METLLVILLISALYFGYKASTDFTHPEKERREKISTVLFILFFLALFLLRVGQDTLCYEGNYSGSSGPC